MKELKNCSGFTLVEVLISIGIITVALVSLLGVIPVSNVAISKSSQVSTATTLAETRVEAIKNAIYTANPAVDNINSSNFPNESYNSVSGYPKYRRTVNIQNDTPSTGMKTIVVTVYFYPVTIRGISSTEDNVQLTTIIARR